MGFVPHRRLNSLLNTHSFFSEGAGVSSPTRLVERAAELGYEALALTDTLSVSGAVELYQAARHKGIKPLIGATLTLEHDGEAYPLVLIAASRCGYRTLNSLLTLVHEQADKRLSLPVLLEHNTDLHLLTGGRRGFPSRLLAARRMEEAHTLLKVLKEGFYERLWVQLYFDLYPGDTRRARVLRAFSLHHGVPVVAAPEVRYATCDLYPLYDALVCARLGITVETPHPERPRNDAQELPDPQALAACLPYHDALLNAATLASESGFDLLPERLTPPPARLPAGVTAEAHLRLRCLESLPYRYPLEFRAKASERLEGELRVLEGLQLAEFFLVAAEVTDYCRSRGILAAGRGSAAASVVCYLLGITIIDPVQHDLLFERFLHTGKHSMPDVDIDISSARRDEVLAWVEARFGQGGEAMVANRITYRLPSALQDLGRALGLPPPLRNALTKTLGRDYRHLRPHKARQAEEAFSEALGNAPVKEVLMGLLEQLEPGFVRHLAPHSGGVILSRDDLSSITPVTRSSGGIRLIGFNKDDVEALGLIKLDLLGLRMLAVLERTREEVYRTEGLWLDLAALPDDSEVWRLIGEGDTMGLFQIESPGQVRMSVQLKPQNLTDLAHQVALFRPGPIQSNTVHPYVRRRQGKERVLYPHSALEPILKKSYGVILFQEDILRIAVRIGGMTWTEADTFRKRLSASEDPEDVAEEKERFLAGARATVGATETQAESIFNMMQAFRGYGFAESHAWSFAQHAYCSAYLRLHYPAQYLAAVLTEEPGMWSPSTLRQEARRWGVPFLRLDINCSSLYYRTEREEGNLGLRVPLSSVKGVSEEAVRMILLERLSGAFTSLEHLYERVILPRDTLEALIRAGAFDSLHTRREALYKLGALHHLQKPGVTPLLRALPPSPPLARLEIKERIGWDYALKGFSEHDLHPLDLMRTQLNELGASPLGCLGNHSGLVLTAGLVIARQKPPTAGGYAFFVLEDGCVRAQLVISPDLWDIYRQPLRDARVLLAEADATKDEGSLTLRANRLWTLSSDVQVQGYHYS